MVDQIRVVTFETPASPGTLPVTHPDITEPFSAAILIYSGFTTDNANNAHGIIGIGFVAPDPGATTEEQTLCAHAEDAGGGTVPDTGTRQDVITCVSVGDPTAFTTATILAEYSASIAGGVELNFTTTTVQAKCVAILFAGLSRAYTDSSAVTTTAHEDVGGTTDFEPDLVITLPSNGSLNTNNNDASPGLGFAVNAVGVPQVCAYVDSDDSTEPTDADGYIASASFVASLTGARAARTGTISSFDSTGWNQSASAAGTNTHYLALKFSGAVRFACANLAVSSSTGLQAFNAFGFTPDLVLGMSTLIAALDTLTDGPTAAASGYFVTGRHGSRAYTWHHEEGLSGTGVWNASSRQEDVAVLTYDHTGAIAQRATWAGASGSGGFLLDFSVATAGHLTALGIQLIPNPPLPIRRPRVERRGRDLIRRIRALVGGRPIGPPPLIDLLRAVGRIRRAARARLRRRPQALPVRLFGEMVEESTGRVSSPGMIHGAIVGAGVSQRDTV